MKMKYFIRTAILFGIAALLLFSYFALGLLSEPNIAEWTLNIPLILALVFLIIAIIQAAWGYKRFSQAE